MKNLITTDRLIIAILILLIGFGINFYFNQKSKQDKKYEIELKLREALQDSVRTYETKQGEWVSEKRTLQGDIDYLLSDNVKLNEDQKALLNTIRKINRDRNSEREVWAAASIRYKKLIDSLNTYIAGATKIDTTNNLVTFQQQDTSSHFQYDVDIIGVRPSPITFNPEIRFNKIDFPNKQTVTFNFDKNERKDYPLSFSVINTNPYYKVGNIESYAIPTINKETVNPTGWEKFKQWMDKTGKYILIGAGGFVAGAGVSSF